MGMLEDMKTKAKGLVGGNKDKIASGLDKAGDVINKKTGGKHEDKIDKGVAKAQEGLDKIAGDEGQAPPPATGPAGPPA